MGEVAFVNVSHPGEARSRQVQGLIRRHVMKDIGRLRRKRPRAEVIPLQLRTPSQSTTDEVPDESWQEYNLTASGGKGDGLLALSQPLCPSGILGVDLDGRSLQIVHFVKGIKDYQYRPFITIWLRMGLSDSTAFYLSLASALLFHDERNGLRSREFCDNPESMKYYSVALNQLMRRMADPEDCVSAGVIATILGCLCHDIHIGDWKRWSHHVDGLYGVAKLRGGLDALENNIPTMALWLDIVGRTITDESPRFPIPAELGAPSVHGTPCPPQARLLKVRSAHPELRAMFDALQMMSSVADTVNTYGDSTRFWQDEVAAIHLIGPVTHFLLTGARSPSAAKYTSDALIVTDSARLACLIMLSGLKKRFSLNASDMMPLQAKLAVVLARETGKLDGPLAHLRLWALITSALLLPTDMRIHSVHHIRVESRRRGLDAQGAIDDVKELVWVEALFAAQQALLAKEIDSCGELSSSAALGNIHV